MASQSNLSVIDFNKFRCTLCNKYLSIAPIYMFTNESGQSQNICGRCVVPEGVLVSRNEAFEAMAQYLEFPCSKSDTCPKKLRWSEVPTHETLCGVKTVQCRNCGDLHPITNIERHFWQQHKEKIVEKPILVVAEEDLVKDKIVNQFLMVISKEPYLVSMDTSEIFSHDDVLLTVSVVALLESSKLRTFTVTFSNENNTIDLKNKPVQYHDNMDDLGHIINLSAVTQLFLPNKIELKFDQTIPEMSTYWTLFEKLAKDLECPKCGSIMSGNIIACKRGHSICEQCRTATVCSICRSSFLPHRNIVLENVCEKFKDFVTQNPFEKRPPVQYISIPSDPLFCSRPLIIVSSKEPTLRTIQGDP